MSSEPKVHNFSIQSTAWPTVILAAFFVIGVPTNLFLVAQGVYAWWFGVFVGVALYNTAFTLWHEAAHSNVFVHRRWNEALGVLVSVVNLFPGFYRQRHDHLEHHRHLLDIEYDRTVYRARGAFWTVPFRILDEMFTYSPYNKKHGLKQSRELGLDKATYVFTATLVVALVFFGLGAEFLACCVLPRLIVLPIHVFYVCYLPHVGLPNDRKRGTRILAAGPLQYLIFFHNYHAIHHLWPNIPWFLYPKYAKLNRGAMEAYGVELDVPVHRAPIFGGESSWKTGYQAPSKGQA